MLLDPDRAAALLDRLYRTAVLITKDPSDAEDLVQDTYELRAAKRSSRRQLPSSEPEQRMLRLVAARPARVLSLRSLSQPGRAAA